MIIKLPVNIDCGKPKLFAMNLNQYRNTNYRTLHFAKRQYCEMVRFLVLSDYGLKYPKFNKVKLKYTLYRKTQIKCDIANVCSVVDKFACDALVKLDILPEDNYNHVIEVTYKWGGIIKDDEYVTLEITEVE